MAITKPLDWNLKSQPSEILWQILKLEVKDKSSLSTNLKALGLAFGKAKMIEALHKKDPVPFLPSESSINEMIDEIK